MYSQSSYRNTIYRHVLGKVFQEFLLVDLGQLALFVVIGLELRRDHCGCIPYYRGSAKADRESPWKVARFGMR